MSPSPAGIQATTYMSADGPCKSPYQGRTSSTRSCRERRLLLPIPGYIEVVGVHEKTYEAGRSGSSGSIGRPWQLAYDLVYLDDNNRESEVPEEDVRVVHDYRTKTKESMLLLLGTEHERGGDSTAARGRSYSGGDSKSLDARQYVETGANSTSRGQGEGKDGGVHDEGDDGHAGPKVTIHSSRGTFDTKEDGSASAYIINGPETNVAAGSGLRGIRWLRGP